MVVSAFVVIIFALMWYGRTRRLNLPSEPYYDRNEQHTNYISRITYSSDDAIILMLTIIRASLIGICNILKTKDKYAIIIYKC